MGSLARNQALASEVVGRLRTAGVRTFCLCPGGRNAPLVEVLDAVAAQIEVIDFFEERSAAFFAIGRSRRDGRPAAVVTTSGTAAAELLPAMVEAYYSGVPLIAVTADRPRSYRRTGAPQAIEQAGLFGVYARSVVDLEEPGTDWPGPAINGPSHVNVSFDEPLLGGWQASALTAAPADAVDAGRAAPGESTPSPPAGIPDLRPSFGGRAPLVLLGALAGPDRDDVLSYCQRLGAPVLAEASSHLKAHLGPLLLRSGEDAARTGFDRGLFDGVLRVGDIPSWRLWRDLESALPVPVLSVSRKPWPGLTRACHIQAPPGRALSSCLPALSPFERERRQAVMDLDAHESEAIAGMLEAHPLSEPAQVHRLSLAIPAGSFVYLGNSQPLREWNTFAAVEDRGLSIGENRGANGIDGQVSTFLGQAQEDRENWAIVGDLTALYDLASPWALDHVAGRVRLVVINNGGGRIFERMFKNPRFQNLHALTFEAWASLWEVDYCCGVPEAEQESPALIVELRPDDEQTQAFWNAMRSRRRP